MPRRRRAPDRARERATDRRGGRGSRRPPLRRSLLGRFLGVSALVATCSVAATAWLAVQTTSVAIRQEEGQNLADDTRIYSTLLGYAATHPDWDGVQPTVRELARESGRRITLTTPQRRPLAESAGPRDRTSLAARESATVDPLSVETSLTGDGQATPGTAASRRATDRIDARAVGPFRVPAAERAALREDAARSLSCLRSSGITAEIVVSPSGRSGIEVRGSDGDLTQYPSCVVPPLTEPTRTEAVALKELNRLTNECLRRREHDTEVSLFLDLTWRPGPPLSDDGGATVAPVPVPAEVVPAEAVPADDEVDSCVGTARREQLASYVAPPALLFIGDTGGRTVPGLDLSPVNTAKIAGVAALVLALTVGASIFAGIRLVSPLRALTGAAQRLRDGRDIQPVPVTTDNEIGRLAEAFNQMAAHRERMERQRKAMVSDVAHELRTPLSTIRGWLEAAQDGVAEADPAFVDSLLEEAVQLQHIIDDLQDLAAADAGALRLNPEPLRVRDVLHQVATAHQLRADAAGVTLLVEEPAARVPSLSADPVRLRQAVANLVSNAIRHTGEGGTVTLRARTGDARTDDARTDDVRTGADRGVGTGTGRTVVVEVADTGSGIDPADLPHLFDRFWRADKSRNRRTGGSGLGLAIVRKLAEAHGGSVTVTSAPGSGSVFALRLPVPREEGAGRP
ncbi:sensor histidine kinase [Streptomyces hirsutus]|uniref:sensor histidine kinase n=1 Tax=Streptomyces hirsutus TaxID=35620 RepID=UPI0006E3E40A